ncbi:hypothetical protein [Hyalangium minutum]|uniref:hypothetical protein n=1 Tax=Hyalangium minutum TaxID=394096 RepID=UPI0005C59FAC|nr:hypothetical protein [Hyalangium minutum]
MAHTRARKSGGARGWLSLVAVLLGAAAPGCGPEGIPQGATWESQRQELGSTNGLSANGLSANGLSANGLSVNGLSANGLSTSSFSSWFTQAPAQADMLMRYVVRCAVPEGETRTYTDSQTGVHYTWSGGLGLAPGWASGAAPTVIEQQVITACLLAHVNRYGLSVPISVLGRNAQGSLIPFTQSELATYPVREACFFGNLFTQEGLFFGADQRVSNETQYLTRACAGMQDGSGKPSTRCAPLTYVGACTHTCTPDPMGPFYSVCKQRGTYYLGLTTRMRQSDYEQLFPDAGPTEAL